jgi:hypothetical protein
MRAHDDACPGHAGRGALEMMLVVFAALSSALLAAYCGPRWLSVAAILACLALSIGLFLFEIYSPEYGFRMPWLQVQLDRVPQVWSLGDQA